ncbi:MAG: FAD-dependent oxidoreductase [Enterobacter hormaechei]
MTLLDGRRVAATRVVLATGTAQRCAGKASGIRCARGIVVDQQMQTSVPDIYAIGECSEIDGQTFGCRPVWRRRIFLPRGWPGRSPRRLPGPTTACALR